MIRRPPRSTRTDTLFPYTTLFKAGVRVVPAQPPLGLAEEMHRRVPAAGVGDQVAGDLFRRAADRLAVRCQCGHLHAGDVLAALDDEIGRASCRERVCQYV